MAQEHKLTGRDIVCLATQEWDAHWTPVQQIMLRLAPQNRVVYVEPFHGMFAWMKQGNKLLRQQRQDGVPQLREVHPNLTVYRPGAPYLPGNMTIPAAHRWNSYLYRREIGNLCSTLGLQKPLLWSFFAQSRSVLDLGFDKLIYDCVDDWPSFFPNPAQKQFVTEMDDYLCRKADILFVGSDPLFEKKNRLNARTFVCNHAADIPHFAKAADPDLAVPADLDSLPRPRIGFVGMIDELRFDTELVASLAANPNHQIVIIGGFMGNAEQSIPKAANIHVLGMKQVAQLPAYLKGMDVLIMPYRLNETTKFIFPLKLFEYLATGKPVVATPIPAVSKVAEVVYSANGPAEFAACIDKALREGETGIDLPALRRDKASSHTWEAHLARKEHLIADHLLGS